MTKTNFFNLTSPVEIEEMAHCHEMDSLGKWNKVDAHFLNGVLGAGGVYTNIDDYFQYDLALRNNIIFPKPSTHELIFKPNAKVSDDADQLYYAMRWFVNDKLANYTGGWFGANTYGKFTCKMVLTIAVFMNRNTLFKSDVIKKTNSLIYEYLKRFR